MRGWTTEHSLRCTVCDNRLTIAMPIKEAGEGHWPLCPDCGKEMTKVFQVAEARYMSRGFTQRDSIIDETTPLPDHYQPVN